MDRKPLKAGWKEIVLRDGTPTYFNPTTKDKTLVRPCELDVPSEEPEIPPPFQQTLLEQSNDDKKQQEEEQEEEKEKVDSIAAPAMVPDDDNEKSDNKNNCLLYTSPSPRDRG